MADIIKEAVTIKALVVLFLQGKDGEVVDVRADYEVKTTEGVMNHSVPLDLDNDQKSLIVKMRDSVLASVTSLELGETPKPVDPVPVRPAPIEAVEAKPQ